MYVVTLFLHNLIIKCVRPCLVGETRQIYLDRSIDDDDDDDSNLLCILRAYDTELCSLGIDRVCM